MKYNVLTCFTMFFVSIGMANASEVKLQGRGYTHSCGYFSNSAADFSITYRNYDLPWGSRVFVKYGFGGFMQISDNYGGHRELFEWAYPNEIEASSVAPYTWTITLPETTTHDRSSNQWLNALQFVVKVQFPDHREIIEHGSNSTWGFFESKFNYSDVSNCVGPDHPKPDMQEMELTPIIRLFRVV